MIDGQTSSGKTHTMLGGGDQRGVLEMSAEDIFNTIAECEDRDFLLRVSFVEIYNETIRDLISDSTDNSGKYIPLIFMKYHPSVSSISHNTTTMKLVIYLLWNVTLM
jgi:hypothetical protein